jgi:conjugal transfer pilus assembly protein TraB
MTNTDPNSQFAPLPPIDPGDMSSPPRRRRWYEYLGFGKAEPDTASSAASPPPPPTSTSATATAPTTGGSKPEIRQLTHLRLWQKWKNYLAMAAGAVLLVVILSYSNRENTQPVAEDPTKRGQAGTILPNMDRDRENWIVRSDALFQKQQKDIDELKKQTEADRKQLEELMQAIKQSGGSLVTNADGTVSLKLPSQPAQPPSSPPSTLPPPPKATAPQLPSVPAPGTEPSPALQEPAIAPTIRSFKPTETSSAIPVPGAQPKSNTGGAFSQTQPTPVGMPLMNQNRIAVREDDIWIPSGTFIKARLLSGLMAPTGTRASQNPHPVLIELMEDGIAPNKSHVPTKGCFVIGSAVGDLSSERAMIRTETISCVRPDMTTVDSELRGTVTGDDGINGVRGTIVSKQGSLLAQSLLAGFAKGMADVMRFQSTSVLVSPVGAMQTIDPKQAVQGGALGGLGNSMDRLANFYLDLAQEVFPVIEVSAGRTVDVVVTRGFIPL